MPGDVEPAGQTDVEPTAQPYAEQPPQPDTEPLADGDGVYTVGDDTPVAKLPSLHQPSAAELGGRIRRGVSASATVYGLPGDVEPTGQADVEPTPPPNAEPPTLADGDSADTTDDDTPVAELPSPPVEQDDMDEVYDEPQPRNVHRRPFTSRLLRS